MTTLEFILEHAREIMQLCFGVGFFIFVLFLTRALIVATRIMRKVNDLVDVFINYIQKPLMMILSIQKFLSKIFKFFK